MFLALASASWILFHLWATFSLIYVRLKCAPVYESNLLSLSNFSIVGLKSLRKNFEHM